MSEQTERELKFEYLPPDSGDELDSTRLYLEQAGKYELLTAEDEVRLAQSIERGKSAREILESSNGELSETDRANLETAIQEGERDRELFISSNLRLVVSIAKKYSHNGTPLGDLIQYGNEGVIRAVDKFDWRRGFKFSTYATWWIKQYVTRNAAMHSRNVRMPVHVSDMLASMAWVETEMLQRGEQVTEQTLAENMGVTPQKIRELKQVENPEISLYTPIGDENSGELHEMYEDRRAHAEIEAMFDGGFPREILERVLAEAGLKDIEKQIIIHYYGLEDGTERKYVDVSEIVGRSEKRIGQLHNRAMKKLRMAAKRLQETGEFPENFGDIC